MIRIIKKLYELPPKTTLRKIRNRLSGEDMSQYNLDEILHSEKFMRTVNTVDFLSRIQAILKRHTSWVDLGFEGQRVLEIGSGPLMGFGPLAVFLGCEEYVCMEPQFNRAVLQSKNISEKYFLPLYKNLCALNGERMTFDKFIMLLQLKIFVEDKELLQCEFANKFDIVLSKSCLEHIFPLDGSIKYLRNITRENVRFIHVVDFGNHMSTKNPFIHIYDNTPESFCKRFGKTINLYRPSDVMAILENNDFEVNMTPYYYFNEFYNKPLHSYWTDRYNKEELFLKAVIFTDAIGSVS